MSKIDFGQYVYDFTGKPFKVIDEDLSVQGEPPVMKDATLSELCLQAVTAVHKVDAEISNKEKFKRFRLAQYVAEPEEVVLSSEQITKIIELCGKTYSPAAFGAITIILDPDYDPDSKAVKGKSKKKK